MKATQTRFAALIIAGSLGFGWGVGAEPAPRPKAPTPAASAPAAEPEVPKSVFEFPRNPREGRNPFFPESQANVEQPKPKNTVAPMVFVLNGITSPPRRTAMINGRTFEPGESGDVRLSGGTKVTIKCTEIGDASAVIMVGNERRELRLRAGI
jgi:hypothetical protein